MYFTRKNYIMNYQNIHPRQVESASFQNEIVEEDPK